MEESPQSRNPILKETLLAIVFILTAVLLGIVIELLFPDFRSELRDVLSKVGTLSLRQWFHAIGGSVIALVLIVVGFISFGGDSTSEGSSRIERIVDAFLALVFTLVVYLMGSYLTYNFALNAGESRTDASIRSLSSVVSLGDDFARHMYSTRDLPVRESWSQFLLKIEPKPADSLNPGEKR